MPKLAVQDVRRKREHIEQAALRLFVRRGYHATSVRDIAREARVSLGNIYNYYPTKENLFASLVGGYGQRIEAQQRRSVVPFLGSTRPRALARLARAIRRVVYANSDYWRLMYIDVIEFGNRHFAHSFRALAVNLARYLRQAAPRRLPRCRRGIDPALAATSIYLQLFTYFLVEKLFGGKQHLGMREERAVEQLIRIYTGGVNGNGHVPAPAGRRKL